MLSLSASDKALSEVLAAAKHDVLITAQERMQFFQNPEDFISKAIMRRILYLGQQPF